MLEVGHKDSKTGKLENHLLSKYCKATPRAKYLRGD